MNGCKKLEIFCFRVARLSFVMMVCFDFSNFSLLAETKNFWGFLSLFTVDSAEKREDFLADVNVTVKICFRRRCVQGPRDILTESKADNFIETFIKRFEF